MATLMVLGVLKWKLEPNKMVCHSPINLLQAARQQEMRKDKERESVFFSTSHATYFCSFFLVFVVPYIWDTGTGYSSMVFFLWCFCVVHVCFFNPFLNLAKGYCYNCGIIVLI